MEKELFTNKVMSIEETLKMITLMENFVIKDKMDKLMKVIGNKVKNKAMVFIIGLMVVLIKEIMLMVKDMEKEQ
jgi:hypothetical protein